jgi:arylsulfatase
VLGGDWYGNGIEPGGVDSYQSYGRCWANYSNVPLRFYKKWTHEGGNCTPFVARWPGVIQNNGAVISDVGHIVDLMMTCCDVANTVYPEVFADSMILPARGISLVPLFKGEGRDGHQVLYWEHYENMAVRIGNWKLVAEAGEPWELYNLKNDRTELDDLSLKMPAKVEEMDSIFFDWAEDVGVETKRRRWSDGVTK